MENAITAIGTANPLFKQPQLETAELVALGLELKPAEKRLLKAVYKAAGIDYRYSVLSDYSKMPGEFTFFPNDLSAPFPSTADRMALYKDNALDLAITAILNCLDNLKNLDRNEITHLIIISCTGMYAPGLDIEIVQKLQLNSNVKRTAINFMGCYGAFNGIKVADAFCQANPNAKVLMVCVELCTIHFQKNKDVTSMISNAIFADGAAAILIEKKPVAQKCLGLTSFHCDLIPQTSEEMAWKIGDFGFDILLSTYVPEVIQTGIANFMQKLLKQSRLTTEQIALYAIHPGGLKILKACEAALNISEHDNRFSYEVLKNYGNMSSATVLFVLKKLWENMASVDNNKTIFSCAFGPGLTLESMLLNTHGF